MSPEREDSHPAAIADCSLSFGEGVGERSGISELFWLFAKFGQHTKG